MQVSVLGLSSRSSIRISSSIHIVRYIHLKMTQPPCVCDLSFDIKEFNQDQFFNSYCLIFTSMNIWRWHNPVCLRFKLGYRCYSHWVGIWSRLWFSCGIMYYREVLFAGVDSFWRGGSGTRLLFYRVLRLSWYFLRSSVLSRSATREAIYHVDN